MRRAELHANVCEQMRPTTLNLESRTSQKFAPSTNESRKVRRKIDRQIGQ
jgi:hypothetical protein